MNVKVIQTNDGAHTIYNEKLDETYHSTHGAYNEAMHVFINNGLDFLAPNFSEINILEIGLGTGLNALLTLEYAVKNKIKVNFISLEPYPLSAEIITQLNYHEFIKNESSKEWIDKIHTSEWEKEIQLDPYFSLHKIKNKLEDHPTIPIVDLVYYDAFGPRAQNEMWESHHFDYLYKNTKDNGILVTYCAQGQFRRNLKATGWTIEKLSGPPGKREMTRAKKTIHEK